MLAKIWIVWLFLLDTGFSLGHKLLLGQYVLVVMIRWISATIYTFPCVYKDQFPLKFTESLLLISLMQSKKCLCRYLKT